MPSEFLDRLGNVLLRIVRELASAVGRRQATLLLTIDQTEELFNSGLPDSQRAFLRFLGASLVNRRQAPAGTCWQSVLSGQFARNFAEPNL
jgi:hypothetical protein